MQVCPVAAKTPAMMPLAAASRSASGNTTWADLPPSSSVTRARWLVAPSATSMPVLRRAGERDLVDAGVAHERAPDGGAVAGDDVEDAVRDARLGDELGQLERGHRRVVARLDDHRAAGGQRRRELPGQQQQRRVPRHDRRDHADRLAPRERDEVRLCRTGCSRRRSCPPSRRSSGTRPGSSAHLARRTRAAACPSRATRARRAGRRRARSGRRAGASAASAGSRSSRPTRPRTPCAPRRRRARRPPRRRRGRAPTARRCTDRRSRRSGRSRAGSSHRRRRGRTAEDRRWPWRISLSWSGRCPAKSTRPAPLAVDRPAARRPARAATRNPARVATVDLPPDPGARAALPHLDKGLPLDGEGVSAAGANVLREDLPLPVCTLRDAALRANSRALLDFLGAVGRATGADVVLAPHGKTTMSPELFRRQLDDGCFGITLATARQVRVARALRGRARAARQRARRPPRDRLGPRRAAARPGLRVHLPCRLGRRGPAARRARRRGPAGRPLDVLVEAGYAGGRCGVRTLAEGAGRGARRRRRGSAAAPRRGRGLRGPAPDAPARGARRGRRRGRAVRRRPRPRARCRRPARRRRPGAAQRGRQQLLRPRGADPRRPALGRPTRIVVRSGCYLTHDAGLYEPLLRGSSRATRSPAPRASRSRPRSRSGRPCCRCRSPGWRCSARGGATSARTPARPRSPATPATAPSCDAVARRGARIERVSDQHAMVALPGARASASGTSSR